MADDVDEWIEKLLAELKSVSTTNWASEKEAFPAMPATIERVIRKHADRIDPGAQPSYCERAKLHFDELVKRGDPHAGTLRLTSTLLSKRIK
jgi:hypothetical protein